MISILIIGFIVPDGFRFEFVFLQLIAGIVSILTVLKMYKRSQLFMSVAKVIAVYFVIYVSFSITHDGSFVGVDFGILVPELAGWNLGVSLINLGGSLKWGSDNFTRGILSGFEDFILIT